MPPSAPARFLTLPSAGRRSVANSEAWAQEKRRRRRESHNAVERRRRDNINDRITELSMIVPDCIEESTSPQKPNKGIILRKSADYIRYLQEANMRLQKQLSVNGIVPDAGTDITGPLSAASASLSTAGAVQRMVAAYDHDTAMNDGDGDDDDDGFDADAM